VSQIVRNVSRISRLARFLTTAPPSFREATIPSRDQEAPSRAAMTVRYRPWALRPVLKTRWNSARRRRRRAGGRAWERMWTVCVYRGIHPDLRELS
jgi:hypothetical protein